MQNSNISWTDHTQNFWVGCTEQGAECDNCYARTLMQDRFQRVTWGAGQPRSRTSAANWRKPFAWDKEAKKTGVRQRVFTNSLADFFDPDIPASWRDEAWEIIRQTPHLDWLLLTKKPNYIAAMLPPDWGAGYPQVSLGVSVGVTKSIWRIAALRRVPASIRFLSCEPLLECLGYLDLDGIHQVIVGGESGPGARKMPLVAALEIKQQCAIQQVAFFFKQTGTVLARTLRLQDTKGADLSELPAMLQVQQYPYQLAPAG